MTEHFKGFSPESRVWVFQADRELSSQDENSINDGLASFLTSWNSHKTLLSSEFKILYNYFVVVVLKDTTSTSGCSIDALTNEVRKIGDKMQINFLKNGNVALLDQEQIFLVEFGDIRKLVKENKIKENYSVFNKQISTLGELNDAWVQPVTQSWMAKYFKPLIEKI